MNNQTTKLCKACKQEVNIKATKCPHCQTDLRNWFRKHWLITGIIGFILFVSVISNLSTSKYKAELSTATSKAEMEQVVIFDIPSVINLKTLEEVKVKLGTPTSEFKPSKQQLQATTEWEVDYKKDGEELMITYDYNTRKIKDYFLSSKEGENNINDTFQRAKIARKLNLSEQMADVSIEYVKAIKDPNIFTGIIVTKKDPLGEKKEYNAIHFASRFIKENIPLKSPSSADYELPSSAELISENTYKVSSYVDAKNSFNAEIRSYWDMTVQYTGPEDVNSVDYTMSPQNWKIKSLTFDGQKIK